MDNPLTAEAALLQALLDGPGYGLELIDRVRSRTHGRVKLGQGSVYPALRSMERQGLLTTTQSDPLPERGGRVRVYYRLTSSGRRNAMRHAEAIKGLIDRAP
jgi:DNA-binding PadR family transcriptional regulator